MTFRTIADFEALTGDDALTEAETALIAACRAGELCVLGDGKRPETDSADRRIRATLLRLLIVGGSDSCDLADRGVNLWGGWIDGELNLDFATGRGFTILVHCHFTHQPQMNATKLGSLNLSGSKLPGLFAQGIKVAEDVFLHADFHATGTVDLSGADIGGQLDCTKGRFDGNGEMALNGQKAKVAGGFFWQNVTIDNGTVDLNGAHVGDHVDDLGSWPKGANSLDLDGFTYDRIASLTDTKQRLEWL
ncbi:MAG: hypothetical protein ACI92Z_003063 [Paracoccaceae bacterium]|jgi:hypothetical protein